MRTEFLAGVRAELPLLLGVVPFGLLYGTLARETGVPAGAAIAMSSIVFAGSAQLIATQLLAGNAPAAAIWLTTFVVNLRHLLYGASVAPSLRPLRRGWKWLLGYLLTDEAYAVAITRPGSHIFFLGAGLTLWTGWQLSTAAGVALAAAIPASRELEFLLPLIFIAIIVPGLSDRAARVAALSAALVAVIAAGAPMRIGLMAGAVAGITAGWLMERR